VGDAGRQGAREQSIVGAGCTGKEWWESWVAGSSREGGDGGVLVVVVVVLEEWGAGCRVLCAVC